MKHPSIFDLIGERYLDTEHSKAYLDKVEKQLKARNVVGLKRFFLEYIGASTFWWNVIWWDWVSLNERDVIFGWILNIITFGLSGYLSTLVFPWWSFWVVFGLLHLVTLTMGLKMRQGD